MSTDSTSNSPPESPEEGSPLPEGDVGIGAGEPSVFAVGRVLAGKYRIDGVLGHGGMGVVHAGRQLELDRPVAIKCLRRAPAEGARSAQRFAREARAIAKMRSEHVVRVFDVGVEDGLPFIVMERLMGRDLAAELERGPLSAENTARYLLQACEAIAEAHSLGIVHRDLKPSNLFIADTLGERRMVKVLDFGVSKWLGPTPETETPLSTGAHGFVGTPAYMSPEQLTRPDTVDERTDVWALGVVLHRCLSGELPFETDSVPRLCAAILTDEPRSLRPPGVAPEGLRATVLRCLKKAPEDRFQNILELARALAPFGPPAGRQSLELIERLSQRPAPEIEVQRTPVPVPAATPANQSTTAGLSQETRVSGAPSPARFRFPALGRRRLSVLLVGGGLAAVGVAVSMTRNTDDQPPVERPLVAEPDGAKPATLAAPATLSPVASPVAPSAGKLTASASATSAVPPASQRPRGAPTRRATLTGAPGASATPTPSSSTAAPPPSAHSPAPSPVPSARSNDDFDRNIYRR